MTSTAGVFAFLLWRTLVGAARRRLARLREPRYLLGGIVGALYLYSWLIRPAMRGGGRYRGAGPALALPPEAVSLILILAAAGLALLASLYWLFHKGTPVLQVSEAEVQFLAPAPLHRQALLHFSLLRTEMALLFSAVVAAWVGSRAFASELWQAVLSAFVVFSTLQLHATGLTFWKARRSETRPTTGRRTPALAVAGALLGLSVLAWLALGVRAAVRILLSGPADSGTALLMGLAPWAGGAVPAILLAPFRLLLAPVFALDRTHFFGALPGAVAILAAHYVWVVRANVRYEEAALEGARRRAARLERRRGGRLHGLPSEARRRLVPFPLPAEGRPEMAVFWKNLMSHHRARLGRLARGWAVVAALILVVAAGFGIVEPEVSLPAILAGALICGTVASILALVLPMANRNDFREDLERAAVLRSWPLSPVRLAAAELAAPLVASVGGSWAVLSFGAAGLVGAGLALLRRGGPWVAPHAGPLPTSWIAPGIVALALLLPALSALVLVVQNAAALAFPAWFPPGAQRRGLEAMGTRIIAFAGTMLLLLLALVPASLAAAAVGVLAWRVLGPWSLVPATAFASLPVWVEVAAGVALLGRLFARFDVSSESWT